MENQTKSNAGISILRYAGTYIGAVIGSGFASGQEPLQFFASYGYWGILGAILVIVLFAWYGYLFMAAGYKLRHPLTSLSSIIYAEMWSAEFSTGS